MVWYKDFFENWYLDLYLPLLRFKPSYIKKEVSFINRVLNLPKGAKILDLCCGHGRHLIPLAKMGYQMIGLDLSKKALSILAKRAKNEKLKIRIIRADMREIPFKNEFDAVINIYTSFGYLETDYEDFKVLKSISKALKPGGKFLIDIINSDFTLANFYPKSWDKVGKSLRLEERIYNPKTRRNTVTIQFFDRKGKWHKTFYVVRIYSLAEMRKNLDKVGLKIVKVYGGTIGNQKFTKNSKRLIILAIKQS